jgi:hypothetical protein
LRSFRAADPPSGAGWSSLLTLVYRLSISRIAEAAVRRSEFRPVQQAFINDFVTGPFAKSRRSLPQTRRSRPLPALLANHGRAAGLVIPDLASVRYGFGRLGRKTLRAPSLPQLAASFGERGGASVAKRPQAARSWWGHNVINHDWSNGHEIGADAELSHRPFGQNIYCLSDSSGYRPELDTIAGIDPSAGNSGFRPWGGF